MLFADQSREALRQQWLQAWRRDRAGQPLQPLEAQIAAVVAEHPEYVPWLESGSALTADFSPQSGTTNPFLHMSLHLAIREQVGTDRPSGIAALHRQLAQRLGVHAAEHAMLEVLGTTLWEAQRSGRVPDEALYLERLRGL